MAIYRGVGGSGDATNDASNQSVIALAAATAAQTSASSAASSASAANASAISAATSATNAANSAASLDVSGLMVKANNLSDLTNTATARTNLGLGSAATTASTAYATAAQGTKADSALQSSAIGVTVQGYDATTLKSAAIGVTVQGYDANTVKKNVANTFTAVQTPQTGTATISATGTFTFNPSTHGQECVITCTTAATITLAISAGSLVAGTVYRLVFVAGDTSARTLAKGATVLASGAALPYTSLATTSGSRDHLVLFAKDTNTAEIVGAAQDVR